MCWFKHFNVIPLIPPRRRFQTKLYASMTSEASTVEGVVSIESDHSRSENDVPQTCIASLNKYTSDGTNSRVVSSEGPSTDVSQFIRDIVIATQDRGEGGTASTTSRTTAATVNLMLNNKGFRETVLRSYRLG